MLGALTKCICFSLKAVHLQIKTDFPFCQGHYELKAPFGFLWLSYLAKKEAGNRQASGDLN